MSIQNGYIFNFNPDGSSVSGVLAVGAASVSFTLPAGVENLLLNTNANCHFRVSLGASTAVATDPMLVNQQGPVVVKLPAGSGPYTLSVIQDGSSTGSLSYVKVGEA